MQLYLSSYRWGADPGALRELTRGTAAVVIANALDFTDDVARKNAATAREISGLEELGLGARELDLRDYFGRPDALREELARVALLWVVGGNAFLLRRAFAQSGLDRELLQRRSDPSIVYGGYSAGAVVVTPTLRGIELVDVPEATAPGYERDVIWEGVGLVPYSIAPHHQSAHPESERIAAVVDYFVAHGMPFRALRDGEVIIAEAGR